MVRQVPLALAAASSKCRAVVPQHLRSAGQRREVWRSPLNDTRSTSPPSAPVAIFFRGVSKSGMGPVLDGFTGGSQMQTTCPDGVPNFEKDDGGTTRTPAENQERNQLLAKQ